jgi:hypothetical protein
MWWRPQSILWNPLQLSVVFRFFSVIFREAFKSPYKINIVGAIAVHIYWYINNLSLFYGILRPLIIMLFIYLTFRSHLHFIFMTFCDSYHCLRGLLPRDYDVELYYRTVRAEQLLSGCPDQELGYPTAWRCSHLNCCHNGSWSIADPQNGVWGW